VSAANAVGRRDRQNKAKIAAMIFFISYLLIKGRPIPGNNVQSYPSIGKLLADFNIVPG
jgi:hypothetical protein